MKILIIIIIIIIIMVITITMMKQIEKTTFMCTFRCSNQAKRFGSRKITDRIPFDRARLDKQCQGPQY
jgi:preprotein translocase subunit SecG